MLSLFSHVCLFGTRWTAIGQAPLSMGFSRQESGVGCHGLFQGIFPTQGSNLCFLSSALVGRLFTILDINKQKYIVGTTLNSSSHITKMCFWLALGRKSLHTITFMDFCCIVWVAQEIKMIKYPPSQSRSLTFPPPPPPPPPIENFPILLYSQPFPASLAPATLDLLPVTIVLTFLEFYMLLISRFSRVQLFASL